MIQPTGLAVFLGAGFSKWAAGLPVASELFDFAFDPFGVRDERRIEIVRSEKRAWDAENPEGLTEQFIAHALASHRRVRSAVLWYIVRRLSEPYIWQEWRARRARRQALMIDENRKHDRPGVTRARDFLLHLLWLLTGVITTNYDLLVEYALGSKHFNYGRTGEVLTGRGPYPVSQWRNPVTLRGSLALAKMHGSISWGLDGGRYTDGRRGITGNALIVAPTPEKTQPTVLLAEWALASHILRQSDRLLVFGFAFNPYDGALLSHLETHGAGIKQVIVVDTHPKRDRVTRVLPQAAVQVLCPPVREGPEARTWFAQLDDIVQRPLSNRVPPVVSQRVLA